MNVQNAKNLVIPEGSVKNIHDKDGRLLWGAVGYDTKYVGDTFQQTYSGKNLFDADYFKNATYSTDTYRYTATPFEGGKTYTFSARLKDGKTAISGLYVIMSDSGNPNSSPFDHRMYGIDNGQVQTAQPTTSSILAGSTIYFSFYPANTDISLIFGTYDFQLEESSTVTSYEPYVGGTASPNPDYPQDIQVVTGEQTVTVNDGTNTQTYTIDLGNTELCKIGTYQDKIYTDGTDWYVHKEYGKGVFVGGTESWGRTVLSNGNIRFNHTRVVTNAVFNTSVKQISNYAIFQYSTWNSGGKGNFAWNTTNGALALSTGNTEETITTLKEKLASNNMIVYYPLATPTDTQITDSTLISQLNAVHQWLTRYGYNATVTGNLPIVIDRTNL